MRLTKTFVAIFALAERLPTSATLVKAKNFWPGLGNWVHKVITGPSGHIIDLGCTPNLRWSEIKKKKFLSDFIWLLKRGNNYVDAGSRNWTPKCWKWHLILSSWNCTTKRTINLRRHLIFRLSLRDKYVMQEGPLKVFTQDRKIITFRQNTQKSPFWSNHPPVWMPLLQPKREDESFWPIQYFW